MIFHETPLSGAFVIDLERRDDARGFFARAFCTQEFAAHGLSMEIKQANLSHNLKAGTLRGLHFQRPPAQEAKFVRCVAGALYDVIVDMRQGSPSYLQHFGAELSAENGRALYVPRGFAHGFLTRAPGTMAQYLVDEVYTPDVEGGLRYDDPQLAIAWPEPVSVISDKDATWPLLETAP